MCVFETKNVGVCFQYLNQISIERSDLVLEISPTPLGGILILQSNDVMEIEQHYLAFKKQYSAQILNSTLIKNINPSLVLAYLSQSQVQIQNQIIIIETTSLSEGFLKAQVAIEEGAEAIDFRCLRSSIHKTIVYLATKENKKINTIESGTIINAVDTHLKSYFKQD